MEIYEGLQRGNFKFWWLHRKYLSQLYQSHPRESFSPSDQLLMAFALCRETGCRGENFNFWLFHRKNLAQIYNSQPRESFSIRDVFCIRSAANGLPSLQERMYKSSQFFPSVAFWHRRFFGNFRQYLYHNFRLKGKFKILIVSSERSLSLGHISC